MVDETVAEDAGAHDAVDGYAGGEGSRSAPQRVQTLATPSRKTALAAERSYRNGSCDLKAAEVTAGQLSEAQRSLISSCRGERIMKR